MYGFVSLKEHRKYICCTKYTANTRASTEECPEFADLHFLASQDVKSWKVGTNKYSSVHNGRDGEYVIRYTHCRRSSNVYIGENYITEVLPL